MPHLRLHTITFFFLLLSAIFAAGSPTYSKRYHHHKGCPSTHKTTTTLPTEPVKPSLIPSQVPTQSHATSTPPATTTPSNPATPSQATGGTSGADIKAYLTAHNSVRAAHNATNLVWDESLASAAQKWAKGCKFEHSDGKLGAFGENLAAGTGGYTIAAAVSAWTDEASDYDPGNPVPSHFTQVVWKSTTRLGCSVQNCDGIFDAKFGPAQYYVCEYSPPGNVIGEFSENVQV